MGRIRFAMRLAGAAATLALVATAAHAQMYRWVDKDGKVQYTDTQPPAFAKDVQKRSLDAGSAGTPQGSYDLQLAVKKFPVVLYTAEQCGAPCGDAKALLAKRGVPVREVVVGSDETRAELKKLVGDVEVPAMTVGRDLQRGYESSLYNAMLDTAGYPKSVPPGTQQAAPRPEPKPEPQQAAAAAPKVDDAPRGRYTPQAAPDSPSAEQGKGRYLPQ